MFEGLLLPWQQIYHPAFFIQFLEQLLKFLVYFILLKYVKFQRSYGFLITKELIFGFQILDLKYQFSASLISQLSNKSTQSTHVENRRIPNWIYLMSYLLSKLFASP